ncbi:fumarylacetoacetate hydrolase family protein [Rhodospirillum sp. A1_3_36]|uniref:fumarylacetoacetate hydrolase family protein n=1 Tax=Rhodospirillum sp. A1_3_36 TaxID=3391666 RepID=UPI0039A48540
MKFATYRTGGRATYGLLHADCLLDLGAVLGDQAPDLKTALTLGRSALEGARDRALASGATLAAVEEVSFDPVIPNPGKILCVGLNYENHRKETGRDKADHPAIFTRFADSLTGHDQPILRPSVSTVLDYEGELAVVIGTGGRYIREEDALSHVFGYACFNDATLRDWQRHTHQFTPGKTFPETGPLGPWLATPDESPDFSSARLETRLNGAVMQSAVLGDMIFPVAEIIAYVSSFTPLAPGDVIATGTPGGVGFKRDPMVVMAPGDVVEVEITGIGLLRNVITDETP